MVENLPASAGDTGSSPGLGRSHMLRNNWAREPQLLSLRIWSLCSATREAAIVRGPCTAMKSGPRLPQLEKALAQKQRTNTAKNKYKNKLTNFFKKRNEDSLRDLWDNIKCNNIHITGVPEGEEREKRPKKIFEDIIVENFPNMGKEIATQVQEAQRVPYRINPRTNTMRHILIKLEKIKDKEKILKAAREK